MESCELKIKGMDCASCILPVEKSLKKLEGVEEASLNFATESGTVKYDPKKVKVEDLLKAVKKAGYEAEPQNVGTMTHHRPDMKSGHDMSHMKSHEGHDMGEDHSAHAGAEDTAHIRQRLIKFIVAAVLSAIVLALTFLWELEYGMEIMMVLTLVIMAYSGREFFTRGIPSLLRGHPGMDTLVALGTGAAFLYSSYVTLLTEGHEEYFMDAAIITTFIILGRYLEARAKGSASAAIKRLLELSAKIAHRKKSDGSYEDIPIDEIQKGDLLRVKPGEKIPVDGLITEGEANINEAMVTGESIPADKESGDKVIGATINGNTVFTMKAEKVGSETMLAQIIKMVKEAQMSKAPIQKLVDVISGYFVWGVIAIATATFLIWMLVMGVEPARALIITVAVLIIACPCALGLATPISIVVGSGKGASMGVLIKKSESLEKTHKITAIAFDKTGTITKGEPEVQEFKNLAEDEKRTLALALALEDHSEHPLAKSVVEYVKEKDDIAKPEVTGFEAITGKGVKGSIEGKTYHLGSSRYMKELGVLEGETEKVVSQWQEKGYTVLVLADGKKVLGLFGVQDGVKETSKEAIKLLKKRGIRTVMLTGDNEKVAKHIAEEVGIDEVHAGVTPDKKKDIIEDLQKEGLFVAMVGDGINDSPALAQADVGIAMGTGTDVAVETGDIVLVKGDLMKAVEAIELSRATLRNIKQNLFWAFGYNAVGIPIAAFGLLNPAFSAGAMALSSISVVLNALRLKTFKVKL